MLIAYSAAIYFALALGGLLALRGMPSVVSVTAKVLAFAVLCLVCFKVTFLLAKRWDVNPVELGAAWTVALLLIVAIEAGRVLRKMQSGT